MKSKSQLDNLENNIDYTSKLREIFEYYCQFGERLNSKILKSNKYIKLFRESGIMDKKIDTTRLEIIYKSINKNNQMNFEQFLNSLIKISIYKYDLVNKKDIRKATKKIINEYILPLYDYINKNFLFGQDNNNTLNDMNASATKTSNFANYISNKNLENFYTDLFKNILIQVVPVLFDMYKIFFSNEVSISDDMDYIKDTSQKNYFIFIKKLEIVPQLLSKSACYQLYKYETTNENSDESIKNNQNFYFEICQKIDFQSMSTFDKTNKNIFGKYFIFFKFLRVILKMSQITFDRISLSNDGKFSIKPEEKFILFLEKIEQTEGFSNFTKSNNTTHNQKTATIIPSGFLEKLELREDSNFINTEGGKLEKENEQMTEQNGEEKLDLYKQLDTYESKYINYINEVYGKDLLYLYKTIVSFGDQFNFQYMKSKAFLKFLVDSNLVKDKYNNFGLKLNDIDIFFIKMCLLMKNNGNIINNNNITHSTKTTVNVSNGEIDYPTFIISIEIIARLLLDNLPTKQAIDTIITDYIFNNKELHNSKINEIDEKIEKLKQLQNNEEMINLLQIMHKAFYPIFIYYSKDNDGLMSNKNFMNFTKDFEIFPYLIGKVKLNSFYTGISQYSSYCQNNKVFIEHSLFVDLIALMALELTYPNVDPSPIEKILIFVDKLSQSQGPSHIVLNTGSNRSIDCSNFIDYFKELYPSYFTTETPEQENFSSIMQNDNEDEEEEQISGV